MTKKMYPTPMLDQLETGPWPSFVTGLKRLAQDKDYVVDLLGQLEHLLQDPQGLLEGRHRRRVRVRRRRHSPLHRGQGRGQQAAVSRRRRIPHPARDAARRHALQHRRAAQDGRHLGEARLGPDRVPRPVRRHHVPGRDQRERAAGVRRDQRAGFRPRRRRPRRAHVDVLRRRRALRAVLLRRGLGAPHRDQQLPRRHPPAVAAVQVQVQVLGLSRTTA